MTGQNQSRFGRSKVFVIGGKPSERAAFCYVAFRDHVGIEPLETINELSASDVANGYAFVVANESSILRELKTRLVEAENFVAPIIAFAAHASVDDVVDAFHAGASSFIDAPFSFQRVQNAVIAAVQKGELAGAYSNRSLAANRRLSPLTPREREVVEAMADGLSNKLIGRQLSISPRTVEIHRARALDKLGVSHTADAIRLVLEAKFYVTLAERLEFNIEQSTVGEPQVFGQA